MIMAQTQKQLLAKELSDILGFDDGASDVLDHLLTIDSREDLLDYLAQLLGSSNDKVKSFVDNVGRFQSGETIVEDTTTNTKASESRGSTERVDTLKSEKKEKKNQTAAKEPPASKKMANKKKALSVPSQASNNKPESFQTQPLSTIPKSTVTPSASTTDANDLAKKEEMKVVYQPKISTEKGTASIICGCFGTRHKPLTNCLHCGRISCEREGYDFCPFCTYLVLEPIPPKPEEIAGSEALQLKEKMLKAQQNRTKQTKVYDDQADYFSNKNSAWLSEQERAQAEVMEHEREERLHRRTKLQLRIE